MKANHVFLGIHDEVDEAIFPNRHLLLLDLLAGFMAGGYLAQIAADSFAHGTMDNVAVAAFFVGGFTLAVLVVVFLDWALIATSTMFGTAVISNWAVDGALPRAAAFVVLYLAGAAVQARGMAGSAGAESGRTPR